MKINFWKKKLKLKKINYQNKKNLFFKWKKKLNLSLNYKQIPITILKINKMMFKKKLKNFKTISFFLVIFKHYLIRNFYYIIIKNYKELLLILI